MLRTLLHSCRGAAAAVLSVVLLAGPGAVHVLKLNMEKPTAIFRKHALRYPLPQSHVS